MAEQDILTLLKSSKLFQGVDQDELEKVICSISPREKEFRRNQIIINQGEAINKIGILKKGRAISLKYHFDGSYQILRIYYEGEVFSLDTVNTSLSTSPVTLISQTDSVVAFIPYSKIFEPDAISGETKKIIVSNSSQILSNELVRLMYKIDVLSKRTLRERVLTYLSLIRERSGESTFDIGMNQEEFAQYLCVNRSVLSNELNKMRKSGLIDYRGNRYTIGSGLITRKNNREGSNESGHF